MVCADSSASGGEAFSRGLNGVTVPNATHLLPDDRTEPEQTDERAEHHAQLHAGLQTVLPWVVRHGDLGDSETAVVEPGQQFRGDDRVVTRQFHRVDARDRTAPEQLEAAVDVPSAEAQYETAQPVPDPSRHATVQVVGAGFAVADGDVSVVVRLERLKQQLNVGRVELTVGVAERDVLMLRVEGSLDTGLERGAVALVDLVGLDLDAVLQLQQSEDLGSVVGRAVINDDETERQPRLAEVRLSETDHLGEVVSFVVGGHEESHSWPSVVPCSDCWCHVSSCEQDVVADQQRSNGRKTSCDSDRQPVPQRCGKEHDEGCIRCRGHANDGVEAEPPLEKVTKRQCRTITPGELPTQHKIQLSTQTKRSVTRPEGRYIRIKHELEQDHLQHIAGCPYQDKPREADVPRHGHTSLLEFGFLTSQQ
ncbi:hypothetical protein BH09PAT3_BH09PAT3_5310 [soil metagenome]